MFLATDLSMLNYLNYIFYVVLGLAILAGFLRGFKKTIFTFITMAIFYVVFFVTINQAVEFLWSFEMPWLGGVFGNIDPALSSFTSFEGSLNGFLEVFLGDTVDIAGSSAEALALVEGLVKFIVKIVWTVGYFTVILLVYKLIMWIIGAIFFKTHKGSSKNRGLGAVIGIANGAMAVFVTLIMLGGVMSIAESAVGLIGSTTPDEVNQMVYIEDLDNPFDGSVSVLELAEESEISDMADQLQELVDAYNNNVFVKIASNITTTSTLNEDLEVPLHINLFDTVLSFDYNENTIGFRYELAIFSEAASVFLDSEYATTSEITDITGDEIRDLFSSLSQSNLIVSLIPVGIELASDKFEQDLGIDIEDLYEIDYENELANLGSIAGALFDILNGAGFIGGEGSADSIELDGEAVRGIFGDIVDSEVLLLLTDNILLPMLEEQEEGLGTILTIPDDLDIETELLAIGDIFAEIIDADIAFSDLQDADVSVLLGAVSNIDLEVLIDSQIVSTALVNILSGQTDLEGLDILEIPTGIEWYDTDTEDGELRKILSALNVLADVAQDIDFSNLDVTALTDMTSTDIDTFFDSYVIRATISEIINSTELGDVPLLLPDSIYDTQGYFKQTELSNVVEAVTLILDGAGSDFDIMQALNLTSAEIDTLLESAIISATIGKEIYDLGMSTLNIPTTVVTQVTVDSVSESIITKAEIKNILLALAVLDIQDLDAMSFDAGIIGTLENQAGDDLDDTKISTILGSVIVHATVSGMIIDQGTDNGGVLSVPDLDIAGAQLKYTSGGVELISVSEITNILKALYSIDMDDFASMNFEDTSLLLNNLSGLLISSIIHATVSDQIIGLDAVMTIPEVDVDNNPILIEQGAQTYIDDTELTNLINVLNMFSILNPTSLDDSLDLDALTEEADQDTLLASAIMHATVSKTLVDLGDGVLMIPDFEEDTITPVTIERGSVGNEITYISVNELKALINAFNAMGFGNLTSFGTGIGTDTFLANSDELIASSSLQATISDIILTAASGVGSPIIIPDEDQASTLLKVDDPSGATYILSTELEAFIDAVNILGLDDFDTFSFDPTDIFGIGDKATFFASNIMQATASKYILDVSSGDQFTAPGTAGLLIPTTSREAIEVETVASEQIEVLELIDIFDVLDFLGMNSFASATAVDASVISGKTRTEILDNILISESFYVTIDNMITANASVSANIPTVAKTTAHTITMTTKAEIADLIVAVNIISGGSGDDFTNLTLSLGGVTTLGQEDRDEAINSLTIRHYLTPTLKLLPGSPVAPTDFETTEVGDTQETYLVTVCKTILDTNYPTV